MMKIIEIIGKTFLLFIEGFFGQVELDMLLSYILMLAPIILVWGPAKCICQDIANYIIDSFRLPKEIMIIDSQKGVSAYKQVVTVEDVKEYIDRVRETYPEALRGINVIELAQPNWEVKRALGSYHPEEYEDKGSVIKLYPFYYHENMDRYSVDFNDEGLKVIFSESDTKSLQLFTLGHEIGHNYLYRRTRKLGGERVEKFCDRFSEKLNIVGNPQQLKGDFVLAEDIANYEKAI